MVRTLRRIVWLAVLVFLFHRASTFAAAVGDQVELKATHKAGAPLHKEPRGTNDFQRVPDGTRATVMGIALDGRWVKLALPDGRTGWVTSRYVSQPATGAPSPGTSPATITPQRIEEGIVERVADGDTLTVITAN
jgi:micrococcal nuclease